MPQDDVGNYLGLYIIQILLKTAIPIPQYRRPEVDHIWAFWTPRDACLGLGITRLVRKALYMLNACRHQQLQGDVIMYLADSRRLLLISSLVLCKHTQMHAYMHIYICMWMYMYVFVSLYLQCICTYMCIGTWICICI